MVIILKYMSELAEYAIYLLFIAFFNRHEAVEKFSL